MEYHDFMELDDDFEVATPVTPILKGRKRFAADVAELSDRCRSGLELNGLVIKGLRAGDDEGAVEFKILRDGAPFIAVTLLASDTSSYPKEHTFFSFAQETDIPPPVLQVIENVSSLSSRPLRDTIVRLTSELASALGISVTPEAHSPTAGDESESDDGMGLDDEFDYHFGNITTAPAEQIFALKNDFLQVVAAGFRPGITRFGTDDFVVSISLSVLNLDVPPRALAAWDRRLLSSYQNLTLLISGNRGIYPLIDNDGSIATSHAKILFNVGLCPKYKPRKEVVAEVTRNYGLKDHLVESATPIIEPLEIDLDDPDSWNTLPYEEEPEEEPDEGRFENFSLSLSLESLLNGSLLTLIQLRVKYGMGWAGAEVLLAEMVKSQTKADVLVSGPFEKVVEKADRDERSLRGTYQLPPDPLYGHSPGVDSINLPLIAFSYLVRRLMLCPRYCLVCHQKIVSDFEALKPYVCDAGLCAYQFYALSFGTSIEYEIQANPAVVDLLVSLTYVSAREGQLRENLPTGLGLRVRMPSKSIAPIQGNVYGNQYGLPSVLEPSTTTTAEPGKDGLVEFDELTLPKMRAAIVDLIDELPPVIDMRKYLQKKVAGGGGKARLNIRKMKEDVLPAAWVILRWCVASCTAYLEELVSADERVQNMDSSYRQFRFSVGAPTAEAQFREAVTKAQEENPNAIIYPSLYAFHGSPLRNWHSIIRQGLHFKDVAHGRAYGHGVYFAKDGSISTSGYAQAGSYRWKNSTLQPNSCVALAEIVNFPSKFVSSSPYFVVNEVTWIMTRYLLVAASAPRHSPLLPSTNIEPDNTIPLVPLDPAHPITLGSKKIQIPEQAHKLERLLEERRKEHRDEEYDQDDAHIFAAGDQPPATRPLPEPPAPVEVPIVRPRDDWQHDPVWVEPSSYALLPPPMEASPMATLAVQKELRAILKEQEKAKSLRDLGFYMPPELMTDNLFQWMVEMHSFEPTLPIAQDMAAKKVNSILFEIRFPPTFPHSPPFFRIIKPRFLPFIHGGGGHVTGGGSICMDLLVADGWLPSYSISAILLQIKLAISNLEPRPARLASQWNVPYGVQEALEGFKRAAATHGWKIPPGTEKLVR